MQKHPPFSEEKITEYYKNSCFKELFVIILARMVPWTLLIIVVWKFWKMEAQNIKPFRTLLCMAFVLGRPVDLG